MDKLTHSKTNAQQADSTPQKFYQLFHTPVGVEILELLRNRTIERPTIPVTYADGMTMAIEMGRRDGENGLVRWIEANVKKGATLK